MLKRLPSMSQASSMVLQEKQRRELKSVVNPLETESLAFLVHQTQQPYSNKSLAYPTSHGFFSYTRTFWFTASILSINLSQQSW